MRAANVQQLAKRDTMTSSAQRVFYINHPNIESDVSQFRNDCHENEKTIILGCYHSNQAGIFVYNVTDPRLAGVQEVTSAHEMLHAMYDRLSRSEKKDVNSMLQNYYNNGLHDQRIIDTINSYKQSEPKDLVNEMHSIFGTEIANLPTPLEKYYSRYFINRNAVTSYAAAYQGEFSRREDQLKTYESQLKTLKTQIDNVEQSLNSQQTKIESDRAELDSLKAEGRIAEYNSKVASFNNEVDDYNVLVQRTRTNIRTYNELVDQYNSLAHELASLEKAIDSRTPATQ
jgi:chromosome segregation ATPase